MGLTPSGRYGNDLRARIKWVPSRRATLTGGECPRRPYKGPLDARRSLRSTPVSRLVNLPWGPENSSAHLSERPTTHRSEIHLCNRRSTARRPIIPDVFCSGFRAGGH
ncbi:hypothetical protein DPEC_G00344930 [Dallia pectoralis]|uniref:Uncharacterized protein n=1 Tax=Dallia pectoralis TaxID=75939 RepID=A0ACC2F378_DALPE|nr:hypothetical protein DPEC_G00344930 [Dallia pectoralis]